MLRPLRGYCLVEPIDEEEKTPSGLIMPDSAKDKPMKGKVLEVGEAYVRATIAAEGENQWVWSKPEIEVGNVVIYKQWGGQDVKHEGKEYKLVKFDELLAVIE